MKFDFRYQVVFAIMPFIFKVHHFNHVPSKYMTLGLKISNNFQYSILMLNLNTEFPDNNPKYIKSQSYQILD